MTTGLTVFDTAIGVCGLAWRGDVVAGTSLPDGDAARTRASLARRFPDAVEGPPPSPVQAAVDGIVALLSGARVELASVPLDFSGVPEFNRRAYEIARTIPPGRTLTYGDIAHRLGMPGSAQAVGQAMGHNPFPIIVPCHRVLAAGGKDGGFSARGGVGTKRRMLVIEGALADEPTLF
ncbi:Methylated-DNA--protein-cysteine methyltransferase (EC [Amycolatopsis camponoti]|uniref:methylated-DNA--[protein]-cysteine S-methyltransferase n=1 Tax=Amycolatopsis camponoti TaxID=2606593 RepID=A0A6I8MC63_9PSEU|nr:methylated-DNA--[protein]-cysteine S-methyltransferase [Amycolatopsis camponoti]VVJ25362.1 Methylated-DNA--protein-cysteine methyltransferase (EC [Amycolatopsis camponoti]